jgi:hypothetical protein
MSLQMRGEDPVGLESYLYAESGGPFLLTLFCAIAEELRLCKSGNTSLQ